MSNLEDLITTRILDALGPDFILRDFSCQPDGHGNMELVFTGYKPNMDIKWKIEHLDIIRQGIEQERAVIKEHSSFKWMELNTVLHHINEALKILKKYA